jgi:hypothetical protein
MANGDLVESRVRVKEGSRRILLLELSSAAPPRGQKGYATHATHSEEDDAKSSGQRRYGGPQPGRSGLGLGSLNSDRQSVGRDCPSRCPEDAAERIGE